MRVESRPLVEHLPTDGTLMRRLLVVNRSVHSQSPLLAKALSAHLALERLLLRVNVSAKMENIRIVSVVPIFVFVNVRRPY